jgi:hypothetical protein
MNVGQHFPKKITHKDMSNQWKIKKEKVLLLEGWGDRPTTPWRIALVNSKT